MSVSVSVSVQLTHNLRTLELWYANFRRSLREKSIVSYLLHNKYFTFLLVR